MNWRALILLLLCGAMVAACGRNRGERAAKHRVDLPFKATLDRAEDPRDFTVSLAATGDISPEAIDTMRESIRYPATRYCLYNFGGSDIDWQTDAVSGDWAVSRNGERLAFHGRCQSRS